MPILLVLYSVGFRCVPVLSAMCRHDLDVVVDLHTNLRDFEAHTAECLDSICRVLCSSTPVHVKPAANRDADGQSQQGSGPAVQSGWQLESKSAYWVWLVHPQLGLSLDIKVGLTAVTAHCQQGD